jgi:hypothetical protein
LAVGLPQSDNTGIKLCGLWSDFGNAFARALVMVATDEHRVSPRHRVLKAGTIEFGGGAIDCTIRNMSTSGAALEVVSPVGIPDQFELVIQAEHLRLPCRVIWRKQKRIGVAFA